MATYEEVQKLIMKVEGKEELKSLQAAVETETDALIKNMTALEKLQAAGAGATAQAAALQKAIDASANTIVDNTKHIQKLQGEMRNWGPITQQAGYALGDLAQTSGDLGQKLMAVTNNAQFMLAGFGPWGIAIGVVITAVASLVRNWDALKRSLSETHEVPKSTDEVKRLTEQLESNKKVLDKLRDAQHLTNEELKKYNDLTAESIRLEKEKTELEQKIAKAKEVEQTPAAEKAARGAAFMKAVSESGGGGDLREKLLKAVQQEAEYEIEREKAAAAREIQADFLSGNPDHQAFIDKRMAKSAEYARQSRAGVRDKAGEAYVIDLEARLKSGDETAMATFNRLATGGYGVNFGTLPQKFQENLPENQRKRALELQNLEVEANSAKKQLEEETKKLLDDFRKDFMEQFHKQAAATTMTPEEFDRQARKAFAQAFQDRGGSEQASNLAAAQFVREARAGQGGYAFDKKKEQERQAKQNEADNEKMQKEQQEREAKERQRENEEIQKGLGPEFLGAAENQMVAVQSFRGTKRERQNARAQFSDQLQRAAYQRLVMNGVEPGRAAMLATKTQGFVAQRIQDRRAQAVALNPAPQDRSRPRKPRAKLKAPVIGTEDEREADRQEATQQRQAQAKAEQGAIAEERERQRQLNIEKGRQFEKGQREAAQKRQAEIMGNATKKPGDQASASTASKSTELAAATSGNVDTLQNGVGKLTGTVDRLIQKEKARGAMLTQFTSAIDRITGQMRG